jgi:hypothetical protein
MDSFKNLRVAIITLIGVVIVAFVVSLIATAYRPSDTLIKGLVEKQMEKRLKGATITSITLLRGATFPSQAHESKVPYGTPLYPVVVKVTYVTKPADGSAGETKEINQTLNLYKDPSHHWINDNELH